MKVSFIIPVYNCEKYMAECIESVLANRCDFYEQEILLIDDGSKDSSGAICDRYAAAHPEIKVIHQVNQGVSVARNAGLDVATGEWVMFIDADDILRRDAMRKLYKEAEFYKYDTTRFGAYLFGEGKGERTYKRGRLYSENIVEYRDMILANDTMHGVWGGIYRMCIITDKHIQFKAGMKYGEDWLVLFNILCHTQSFSYFNADLYGYRFNPASAMHVKHSHIRLDSYGVLGILLGYAKEADITLNEQAIERHKSQLCVSAIRFALSNHSRAAFVEAEEVMSAYCKLPYSTIMSHCKSNKQRIGVIVYRFITDLIL